MGELALLTAASMALLGTPAQAEPVGTLDTPPAWCGHGHWVVQGNWIFNFYDHWQEAGGAHMHYYYGRYLPNATVDGTRVLRC